jgi:hypothetical protein
VAKDGSAFSLPFKKVKGRKEENPSRRRGEKQRGGGERESERREPRQRTLTTMKWANTNRRKAVLDLEAERDEAIQPT